MLRSLLLTVAVAFGSTSASAQLSVGEPFPTTAFADAETGELRSVSDFRGKPLLLHLYASW